MHSSKSPVALSPPILPSTLLTFILNHHKSPTTLVICSARESFLEEISFSTRESPLHEPPSSQPTTQSYQPPHSLLVPRLHLIAKSQDIKLIYAPTLPHLRAFLATRQPAPKTSFQHSNDDNGYKTAQPRARPPLLAIFGLAKLHHSTAEHSAQGLSRTLASAVEAAAIGGEHLLLIEPPLDVYDETALESAEAGERSASDPWKEQVPILSGSIRFGDQERVWAGKTVEVGRVFAKWCRFQSDG